MCCSSLRFFWSQSKRKSWDAVCVCDFAAVSKAATMTKMKYSVAPSHPWRTESKNCSVGRTSLPWVSSVSSLCISTSPRTSASSAPHGDESGNTLRTLHADLHWMMWLQSPATSNSFCENMTGLLVSNSSFKMDTGNSGLFNRPKSNKCWHRKRSEKETPLYPEKIVCRLRFVCSSCSSIFLLIVAWL